MYGGQVLKGTGSFIHNDKPFHMQHMNYLNGKTDKQSLNWQLAMYNELSPYVSDQTYQNYPSLLIRDPLKSYFGSYLPKLEYIRKIYDKSGFFYQNQNIPN